jgi:hypothetical protein
MTTDDIQRLRKGCIRIAEQQYARSSEGAQQQHYIETAAHYRERANRQETAKAAEQDRTNTRMRGPLAAGTATALEESSIQGSTAFELGRVFRSFRRIAGAIGMRAHPC